MIDRVAIASPGGIKAASARYRLGPLARSGVIPVDFYPAGAFPTPAQVSALLTVGSPDTVLILQRVMPGEKELLQLRQVFGAVAFDLDDAIYETPPNLDDPLVGHVGKEMARLVFRGSRTASRRRQPLIRTLRQMDVAIVGNGILGQWVRNHINNVVEIPTTVVPVSAPPSKRPNLPVIAWMGLPDNLQYLSIVTEALERLADELDFVVRIISSVEWDSPRFPVEFVSWSEDASRLALFTATVGIAPLVDSPWTRGKCALRAIQYGGHALPTVASPVGITDHVVLHGRTGYLARTTRDWTDALRTLLAQPAKASALGSAALAHVRASYSDAIAVARWVELIESL